MNLSKRNPNPIANLSDMRNTYNAKGPSNYHTKKSKSSISSYSEGVKKKSSKKYKTKSSEKYNSLKRKKLTLDNSTMVLSSCGSKQLEETMNSKKVPNLNNFQNVKKK